MNCNQFIGKQLLKLPNQPGVYYFKNNAGKIIYVGKATSLNSRVSSYFEKAHDSRIEKLVSEIRSIDFRTTPSVLEALILEANEIKRLLPKYNIKEKDDKSFLYLVFTREKFSKPILIRGYELKRFGAKKYKAVYGPYLSSSSIRAALKILRKIFPYSTCEPGQKRPCFYYHINLCPGVCIGAVSQKDYGKNIKHLQLVFSGKKDSLLKELKKEMKKASAENMFEQAAKLRNQIFALEHIQDVAVITREEKQKGYHIFGRIEGYDISNISGVEAVGSMVVFSDSEPDKKEYRKFIIKTVQGANDVAMLREVLTRRFKRTNNQQPITNNWPLPDLILIDGGWGQVNAAKEILRQYHLNIPIVGIAKGFNRKQDRLIFEKDNLELSRIEEQYKDLLLRVRDEAHRFAIGFHRKKMRERLKN